MNISHSKDNKDWIVDSPSTLNTQTHTHIQRQTSWDGRSSEAPVTVRESMCWRGPPDAPSGPCQLSLVTDPLLAGTERNVPGWKRQEQPATWVRASQTSKLASSGTVLWATVLCEWVEGEQVLWKKTFPYQSLVSGLPSYTYFLPALLALSSPSCLIPPSPSSNHVFPNLFLLFHPVMWQYIHLWKSEEVEEEEKGGRQER